MEVLVLGAGTQGLDGGELVDIKLRMPTAANPEVLLVLRAMAEGTRYVAFVGAGDPAMAVLKWRKRCRNGGLGWRPDRFWDGAHAGD